MLIPKIHLFLFKTNKIDKIHIDQELYMYLLFKNTYNFSCGFPHTMTSFGVHSNHYWISLQWGNQSENSSYI